MNNIEVEVRSFITEKQYNELLDKFKKEAVFKGEDNQVTHYFDANQDLRIQKNDNFSKIWLKKGAIHDDQREEFELRLAKEDFEKAEQIFKALGYDIQIKWLRTRNSFKWNDIEVAIDSTKGYGCIIELEKMSSEENKDRDLQYLKSKMQELDITITPKEEFSKKYEHYKENWRQLI